MKKTAVELKRAIALQLDQAACGPIGADKQLLGLPLFARSVLTAAAVVERVFVVPNPDVAGDARRLFDAMMKDVRPDWHHRIQFVADWQGYANDLIVARWNDYLSTKLFRELFAYDGDARIVAIDGGTKGRMVRFPKGLGSTEWDSGLEYQPEARVGHVEAQFAIDDDAAVKRAEDALMEGLKKTQIVDGYVGHNLYRPATQPMTRWLSHYNVTPNHVSTVTAVMGVAAGVIPCFGGYWAMLIGALLFVAAAAIDCVDGGLARLKFKFSRFGQWFDTIVDDVSNIAFFIGVGVNYSMRIAAGWPLYVTYVTVAMFLIGSVYVYYRMIVDFDTGNRDEYQWDFVDTDPDAERGKIDMIIWYALKRDVFSLAFLLWVIIDMLYLIVGFAAIGGFAFFMIVLYEIALKMKGRGRVLQKN